MLIVLTVKLNNEHMGVPFTILTNMYIWDFPQQQKISKNSVIKWWFIPYRIFILSSMKIPYVSLLSYFTKKISIVCRNLLKKIQQEHQLVLPFSISIEKTKYSKSKFLRENSVTTSKQSSLSSSTFSSI